VAPENPTGKKINLNKKQKNQRDIDEMDEENKHHQIYLKFLFKLIFTLRYCWIPAKPKIK
jgi:hypothetical protein